MDIDNCYDRLVVLSYLLASFRRMKWMRLPVAIASLISAVTVTNLSASELSIRERRRVSVPEAHQAVAVDVTSFYAIASRTIARYEKGTSKHIANWSAPAGSAILHLNSGVVVDGRLYCANSNWPVKPLKSSVEIFNAEDLRHVESRAFPEAEGAINWIERHRGSWWIVFAFYGDAEVRRTKLVRYDDQWNQTGEWAFPEVAIQRFLPNSNSGGAFGPNGRLFVTGHDHDAGPLCFRLAGRPWKVIRQDLKRGKLYVEQ